MFFIGKWDNPIGLYCLRSENGTFRRDSLICVWQTGKSKNRSCFLLANDVIQLDWAKCQKKTRESNRIVLFSVGFFLLSLWNTIEKTLGHVYECKYNGVLCSPYGENCVENKKRDHKIKKLSNSMGFPCT